MICWKCLRKMDPWLDERNRQTERCRCGNKPGPGNDQTRADRFMALVAAVENGLHGSQDEPYVNYPRERAAALLRDIESAVESGTLFGEEKP